MNIAYTLFEILNADRLQFRYRFLKVREPLPDDVRQPINYSAGQMNSGAAVCIVQCFRTNQKG